MSVDVEPALLTADDVLAMPEDGTHRELIRGRLIEEPMTYRNRWHSGTEAENRQQVLKNWLDGQTAPCGMIVSGEAGFRLRRDPDSLVGIDVAYASAEQVARANETGSALFNGPPILAVEILSPSEKQEDLIAKVREYLETGVAIVWIVEPTFRTVLVYRPDDEPRLFNVREEITAEPHLPGFRVAVAALFVADAQPTN